MTTANIINSFKSFNLTKKELKNIDKHILCDDIALYYGHNYTKKEIYNHVLNALTNDKEANNERLYLKVLEFISIY